ncbi:MAG: hypothetical protein H7146_02760 [Burkholderiaceae bacterium]|nr:hypothetical protein [Microbacteriaceae bacterium]
MTAAQSLAPGIMPVLSRGKHRTPHRGACFMEFASYLAGERWSDHPACTHPSLAALARLVNDWSSDAKRSRLAAMVPSVIGLVSPVADERIELMLAVRAAATALPIASEPRQRALAVGLIRCEAQLDVVDPQDTTQTRELARNALDTVPLAEVWATRQLAILRGRKPRNFAPLYDAIVNVAIAGIGEACVADTDDLLAGLLERAINDCRRLMREGAPATTPRTPSTRTPATRTPATVTG